MALSGRCFSDFADLPGGLEPWDELACALDRPLAAPALARAWWDHMRPPDAELRLLTVGEGEELAGVLPMVRLGRHYSWAGGQLMPGEPLARPGLERQVAAVLAAELAAARPRPLSVELEIQDDSPPWSTLLCEAWPKPLFDRVHRVVALPRVDLGEDGFEGWMAARTSKFRRDVKRRRRRLEEAGGSLRFSDAASLRADVAELIRLHLIRHHEESVFSHPGAAAALVDVGAALLPRGRFRLVCTELDGRMIGALLLFAAGSGPSAFVAGYEEEFGEYSPVPISLVEVLEDMQARGERTLSLGAGGQSYKYKFATGEGSLTRHYLVPASPRSVGSLAKIALGDRLRALTGR